MLIILRPYLAWYMNLPDGLKMMSMAEFAAYYERSQETRATIEELKLAGGYLSTDKRNEQLRDVPLHLLVIKAVDIFNALVLETLVPLKIIAPLIRRCLPGPVFFLS